MRHQQFLPLALALLLPTACAQAAPPKPDFADLPEYLKALNSSTDPEAVAIHQRITDGPADLARERIAAEKEGLLTRADQLQQPLPPVDQNAAPLYVQLDALRKEKPLHFPMYAQGLNGRYAYTPEQIAVVQREYDARQDIFTLLHEATDKPQCVFVHTGTNVFYSFPEFAGLRESAREVATESILLAYQGKYAEAVANQKRGFHIADQAASEPLFMNFLTGSAIEAISMDGMQSILQKAGPNSALDKGMEADILARQAQSNVLTFRHSLTGEPAVDNTEFERLRQAKPADIAGQFHPGSPFLGTHMVSASARFTPGEQQQVGLLVDAAQAECLRQMREIVAATDLPSPERQEAFDRDEAQALANKSDPIAALSDQLNFLVTWEATNAAMHTENPIDLPINRLETRREVTAAGAAVLAAKAQTGAYPDTLPSQFSDPFTSKRLGYRREGTNGFVVYSAGPDGTFDGGKPGERAGVQILFRYPLVPVPVPAEMLK
ncbi:MAG: hypothetical protein ACRYFS_23240 [Janthinobacterium lividum]